MIVQPRDGQLLLIRQTDHAVLAGVFAEHWGNAAFAVPFPRDPLIVAAVHHDDGWLLWEAAPRIDPTTRRPYSFTAMPIVEHVDFYRHGIDRVLARDSYAGLLTVMHLAGLYQMRFGTDRQIPARTLSADEEHMQRQLLDELQQQQNALRRDLPRQGVPTAWLEERRLWCNYKLLQVFDRLSLYFCMAPPRPATLEPAPLDYDGGETQLTLRPVTERTVAITPYPFGRDPLPLTLRASVVPDRDYDSDDDFRAVFAAAPVVELRFEVCGG
ncbi:MAG TPA: DUF3891 family protein [Gemmataceae bacterium]|jgi:hypothetical protein